VSENLSKYEKLQHRHLRLLRALQQHGVICTGDKDGEWNIQVEAYRVSFKSSGTPTIGGSAATKDVHDRLAVGSMSAKSVGFYCDNKPTDFFGECFQKNWKIGVRIDQDTMHAVIDGTTQYVLKYNSFHYHLLEALCAAIVSAPAKA